MNSDGPSNTSYDDGGVDDDDDDDDDDEDDDDDDDDDARLHNHLADWENWRFARL